MGRIKRRLAWILKETGRNADAKVILEERLQQLEADESASWAELALVKIDLSDVYINEERYDLACEGLNDGIRYAEMCQMMENKSIAHSNLANVLNRMGDFENALTHGLASLELDEAYFEGEHPALAFPLCCVGESLIGAGRPDEALPHLQRAFDIRQAAEVPAGNLAWSQWLLGRAQTESGNRTDGIANVMQARKAFEAMEDSISTELRDLREWLAENA